MAKSITVYPFGSDGGGGGYVGSPSRWFVPIQAVSVEVGIAPDETVEAVGGHLVSWDRTTDLFAFDVPLSPFSQKGIDVYFASKNNNYLPYNFIQPALDLDADNILGLNDNDPVATWPDVSGNGFDATEATNQPIYKTAIVNGNPIVRFDGTEDVLRLSGGALDILNVASGATVFFVGSPASDGTRTVVSFTRGGDDTRMRMRMRNASTVRPIYETRLADDTIGNNAVAPANNSWALNTATLITASTNGALQTQSIWKDGTLLSPSPTSFTTGTAFPATPSASAAVGAVVTSGAASTFWHGDMARVQVYASALSTLNRRAREAAMTRKYGLTLQ